MSGPVMVDPDLIKPETDLVKKTANGKYRLVTDDSEINYDPGQFIPESKAMQMKHLRRRTNAVKSAMRAEYSDRGYLTWDEVPRDEKRDIEKVSRQKVQETFEKLEEINERDDLTEAQKQHRRDRLRRTSFDS